MRVAFQDKMAEPAEEEQKKKNLTNFWGTVPVVCWVARYLTETGGNEMIPSMGMTYAAMLKSEEVQILARGMEIKRSSFDLNVTDLKYKSLDICCLLNDLKTATQAENPCDAQIIEIQQKIEGWWAAIFKARDANPSATHKKLVCTLGNKLKVLAASDAQKQAVARGQEKLIDVMDKLVEAKANSLELAHDKPTGDELELNANRAEESGVATVAEENSAFRQLGEQDELDEFDIVDLVTAYSDNLVAAAKGIQASFQQLLQIQQQTLMDILQLTQVLAEAQEKQNLHASAPPIVPSVTPMPLHASALAPPPFTAPTTSTQHSPTMVLINMGSMGSMSTTSGTRSSPSRKRDTCSSGKQDMAAAIKHARTQLRLSLARDDLEAAKLWHKQTYLLEHEPAHQGTMYEIDE